MRGSRAYRRWNSVVSSSSASMKRASSTASSHDARTTIRPSEQLMRGRPASSGEPRCPRRGRASQSERVRARGSEHGVDHRASLLTRAEPILPADAARRLHLAALAKRKLRLLLDELRPTAATSVLDIGADELGFGDGDGCATLNFFEEQLSVARAHHGARPARRRRVPRPLPGHPLRPGRRMRAPIRGRRVRRRLLERRDRARGRTRAAAPVRIRGAPRRSPRVHHDAEPPLSGRGAHAPPARALAPRCHLAPRVSRDSARSSRPTCTSSRAAASQRSFRAGSGSSTSA